MSNFQQYTGSYRVTYPAYTLTVSPSDIVDFGVLPVPADGRWTSSAGPATRQFDNTSVVVAPNVDVQNPRLAHTTAGAPTGGTWSVGDAAFDQSGAIYECTVAGTPGTWILTGSGTYAPLLGSVNYRPKEPGTAVLFGDSITANNYQLSGVNLLWQSNGYWTWAQREAGMPFRILSVAGVAGNTTTQMLARIQTDVLAYNPGWVIVEAGVKDNNAEVALSVVEANLTSIYDQIEATGARIIATTITPSEQATSTQKTRLQQVNRWLKRQAMYRKSMILVDWHKAVIDPATGLWATGLSNDGLHPNTTGANLLGHIMAQELIKRGIVGPDTRVSSPLDAANATLNPFMTGTGGTASNPVTGTVPSNWTIGGTAGGVSAVCSIVARTDGVAGNWAQAVVSAQGVALQPIVGLTAGAIWQPNDGFYYEAECDFETDAWTSASSFQCQVDVRDGSNAVVAGAYDFNTQTDTGNTRGGPYTQTFPLTNQVLKGVMRTPPLLIPSTAVTIFPKVRFVGVGTFRVSRFSFRRVLAASDL